MSSTKLMIMALAAVVVMVVMVVTLTIMALALVATLCIARWIKIKALDLIHDHLFLTINHNPPQLGTMWGEENVTTARCVITCEWAYGMIDISSWLLTIIAKKRSTHSESSLFQVSSIWSISLKNEYDFHSASRGEYQKCDLSYGQLDRSVGILKSKSNLKMNFH